MHIGHHFVSFSCLLNYSQRHTLGHIFKPNPISASNVLSAGVCLRAPSVCIWIRYHSNSNVMSLVSCGWQSQRTKRCERLQLRKKESFFLNIAFMLWRSQLPEDFCVLNLHTEDATRQKLKVMAKSKPGAGGDSDTKHQHENIFCSYGTARPRLICWRQTNPRLRFLLRTTWTTNNALLSPFISASAASPQFSLNLFLFFISSRKKWEVPKWNFP